MPTGMERQTRHRKLNSFLINMFNLKNSSISAWGRKGKEKCAILENALPAFILKAQLFETTQKYKGIIVPE